MGQILGTRFKSICRCRDTTIVKVMLTGKFYKCAQGYWHKIYKDWAAAAGQGQTLKTTMSSHWARRDKVVQRKRVKGTERTPWTLHSLVNHFSQWVDCIRIVTSATGVLDIELHLELLEALGASVVDILGIGDELRRRRRSIGSRHFEWRTGWWFKGQWLMLLLSAHDRYSLLWSPLPLPQDSSVHWLDRPQIFFSHSDLKPFGVWCYFYLHLTHPCSIFVTPLSSNPPLSPITPLWFLGTHLILHDSESAYSFYFYLPLCLLLG